MEKEEKKLISEKWVRISLWIVGVMAGIWVGWILSSVQSKETIIDLLPLVLAAAPVVLSIFIAMRYLQGDRTDREHDSELNIALLEARLGAVEVLGIARSEQVVDDTTRAELVASIRAGLVEEASNECKEGR